jgi:glucose-6-phosphate 1-epimerase
VLISNLFSQIMSMTQSGQGGLAMTRIEASDGASAEVYLHGAHVTSWKLGDGDERLFLSPRADFAAGKAIRGGVPVIFPQFNRVGPLPRHGFARNREWQFVAVAEGTAMFRLSSNEDTQAIWPARFTADLTVNAHHKTLNLGLAVRNLGEAPIVFTCALHTYLRVHSIEQVEVAGLAGVTYNDKTLEVHQGVQEGVLLIDRETDNIYYNVTEPVVVREPARITEVRQTGFTDVVVWNPWTSAAQLADMAPEGYREMLCVEAAVIGKPVQLEPNAVWAGTQQLTAVR